MYSIFASLYHTGFLEIYRLQLAFEARLLLVPLTLRTKNHNKSYSCF
jgi:hypothetical protein